MKPLKFHKNLLYKTGPRKNEFAGYIRLILHGKAPQNTSKELSFEECCKLRSKLVDTVTKFPDFTVSNDFLLRSIGRKDTKGTKAWNFASNLRLQSHWSPVYFAPVVKRNALSQELADKLLAWTESEASNLRASSLTGDRYFQKLDPNSEASVAEVEVTDLADYAQDSVIQKLTAKIMSTMKQVAIFREEKGRAALGHMGITEPSGLYYLNYTKEGTASFPSHVDSNSKACSAVICIQSSGRGIKCLKPPNPKAPTPATPLEYDPVEPLGPRDILFIDPRTPHFVFHAGPKRNRKSFVANV